MYRKKFTSICQVLKKDAHKRKLVPLPHGVHTNLYSAKNRENESEALAQDDYTVKTD